MVTTRHWQRHLEQIAPMTAGPRHPGHGDLRSLPLGPWPGLGVLALWAAGALTVGGLVFRSATPDRPGSLR